MLGAFLDGSGIGQYLAPDPSAPEQRNENEIGFMKMIAPDPDYYASKKHEQSVTSSQNQRTPRKTPSKKSSMRICTPSRILASPRLRSSVGTNNIGNELTGAVLSAAIDTTLSLSSPTPVWRRSNTLFSTCSKTKAMSDEARKKFQTTLQSDPSLCHTRSAKSSVPDGYTLLHAAASANNIIAAEILLGMKKNDDGKGPGHPLVSVLTPDLQGRTALHVASEYGHTAMIRLLNQHLKEELGALPIGENAPVDLIGYTPLACAVTSQRSAARTKEVRDELFSPGDKAICPATPSEPRSSMKTDNVVYGYATVPGFRVLMEDSVCCATHLEDEICQGFFGVFDGHSDSCIVSEYLSENVVTEFLNQRYSTNKPSVEDALIAACATMEDKLLNGTFMPTKACGSTAVMAILLKQQIVIGNIGDSRAILVQQITTPGTGITKLNVISVSQDHKPNVPKEKERIEQAGLTVVSESISNNEIDDIHRIYKIENKNQKLSMSRSFGDFDFKSNTDLPSSLQAVTAIPEIYIHERTPNDAFLLLASDGVWDVMSNEEVASFIVEHISKQLSSTKKYDLANIGDELANECLHNRRSEDNISVVIVSLRKEDYDGGVEEIGETMKQLDFS